MTKIDSDVAGTSAGVRGMISVVIPVCNEEESLTTLHAELVRVFASMGRDGAEDAEYIFIDDGSRDRSWEVIQGLAKGDVRVRGLKFRRNFGKAAGLSAGFRIARGSAVFTMDGDLQDDPEEIPRFLALLDEKRLDVISGWKKRRHDPWHKVGPSRVFNAMVSGLTGCRLHDHNCGYKLYRAEVLKEVRIYGELHRFVPVLAYARGFRVGEIVVNHRARRFGASKYGVSRFLKGLLDLMTVQFLTGFRQRPSHVLGALGLLLLVLGGGGLFYLACEWVLGYRPIGNRPFLTYSAVLLGMGTQLLSLGVLAELLISFHLQPQDTFSVSETVGAESRTGQDVSAEDRTRTE